MSDWVAVFLLVWFLGTCAGTTFGILLVRAGAARPAPEPDRARPGLEEEAA